jgi:polyisoprenoid-binding protein YceI
MKTKTILFAFFLTAVTVVIRCKKEDVITPLTGVPVQGAAVINATWAFDKIHSNIFWATDYYDYSPTKLIGSFNNYNFTPKFSFDEANLSNCSINAWVQLSTFDSGEPGRDGPGKCGRSYLGVTYLDTLKTIVDPLSDTAWFHSTSVVKSGTGYVVQGTFSFNRYRTPSGFADGTHIAKPCTMFLNYNGMKDFDTNGDGMTDRFLASFAGTFTFNRSDYMDKDAAIQWVPVPSMADMAGNVVAANNKTYGAWSKSVGDEMILTMNMQFYKDH